MIASNAFKASFVPFSIGWNIKSELISIKSHCAGPGNQGGPAKKFDFDETLWGS